MTKRTLEQSTYIMKEQIGDEHMSLHDLTVSKTTNFKPFQIERVCR